MLTEPPDPLVSGDIEPLALNGELEVPEHWVNLEYHRQKGDEAKAREIEDKRRDLPEGGLLMTIPQNIGSMAKLQAMSKPKEGDNSS